MTKQTQNLTHHDVRPHIKDYVISSFPVDKKNWDFDWYYRNGTDSVRITLTIDGETTVHHVPVMFIVGGASK